MKNNIRELIKDKFIRDLVYGLLIIVGLYTIGILYGNKILDILTRINLFNDVYKLIIYEINNKSMLGLSIITFTGGLFFIAYPAELIFLIFTRAGYSIFYISLIMIITTMFSQMVNYGVGFYIEEKILHKFVRERKKEFLSSLKKYDYFFIILINILPLPADILSVILGMVKYDFRKAMLYTIIGKLLKFVFLILLVIITSYL